MADMIDFETYRKEAQETCVRCELVAGHILQTMATNEGGRKFCFLLGTLLEDYLIRYRKCGKVFYEPEKVELDENNILSPDLMVSDGEQAFKGSASLQKPSLVVDIIEEPSSAFGFVDKAMAYKNFGVKEYWLADMENQVTYIYSFGAEVGYRKYSFEHQIKSICYRGFECTVSDILTEDGGWLKQLALFSKYKKEMYREERQKLVAEARGFYYGFEQTPYTAQAFYDWMDTRKNMSHYTKIVELLLGEIREQDAPVYGHQNIRGNLYFEINLFIKAHSLPCRLCFAPIAVELTKKSPLDSVVVPDLFMIDSDEGFDNNIYRGVPKWIIEITSPQSAGQDYVDKAQLYQYYGVEEYWIINEWKKKVLVLKYHKRRKGEPAAGDETQVAGLGNPFEESNFDEYIYDYHDMIPVGVLPGLEICLEKLLDPSF